MQRAEYGGFGLLSLKFWSRFAHIARSGAQTKTARKSVFFAPLAVAGCAALGLGGCAQQPIGVHSSEYFPQSVYGAASPRVVADGEAVPHGGGKYLVGHPYMVAGHMYYPSERRHYVAVGYASWYGDAFHGRRTANGEIFDRNSISAAHPTMPLPSYARVTNLRNHYSMVVRVNDRGPFAPGRIMDVSRRVADLLDFRRTGTTKVKIEYLGRASLEGSDDEKLASTLRNDGSEPSGAPSMLADADANQPVETASADPNEVPQATPAVAQEQPAAAQPGDGSESADALPPGHIFLGKVPVPPVRPFDLDTIPGAGVPIGETAAQ
jgi:rare lipoprotein A